MENNQEFAIFFSDAPKGKKIGAVLSWIATAILLVALFVPGFRVKFQTQNQNGKYQDIPATETYELNQAKEAWKLNVQLGTNKISGKLNSFLENGKTSVFSYLSDSSLLNAKLMTDENITTDKESGKSPMGWILLAVFFVLIVAAAIAGVYTMSWVTLAANLVGVLELLAVFFLVFKNRFNENGVNLLTGSRVVPAMTAVLIALLVIAAILSVASVIVSYAVHSEEDAEGDAYWDDDDENRNAPTGLIDDNDTAPVTGSIPSASTVVATLIQMNTSICIAMIVVFFFGFFKVNFLDRKESKLTVTNVDLQENCIYAIAKNQLYDADDEYIIHGASDYLKGQVQLSQIKEGETIIVISNGKVLQSDPYQFDTIYSIRPQ